MNGEDARQPEWGFEMRTQSDTDRPITEPRHIDPNGESYVCNCPLHRPEAAQGAAPRHERGYIPLIDNRLRCKVCEEPWPCEGAAPLASGKSRGSDPDEIPGHEGAAPLPILCDCDHALREHTDMGPDTDAGLCLHPGCGCDVFVESESEGAAPRAEGLDWTLVIEAVANTMPDGDTFAAPEVVAAEYARLSRPSDERDGCPDPFCQLPNDGHDHE